jgi:RNase adaptor protein for sRNA GlmZ degradation
MNIKHLPAGVFDADICVMCGTRDEINKYFKRKHGTKEEIEKGFKGIHQTWIPNDKRKNTNYICIVRDHTTAGTHRRGVLVHEIVHCALDIFDFKGVKYNGDNDEHLAYFIEWIYTQAEEVL